MDVKDDVAFSFASNPVLRICGYVSINKDGKFFQKKTIFEIELK